MTDSLESARAFDISGGETVAVLLGDPQTVIHTPEAHRADVVERLLALDVPLRTLEMLLPGWASLYSAVLPAPA